MNTFYKINFLLNGKYSGSVFSYRDEAEKQEALKRWKAEHVTPYNKIEILWHGTLDEWLKMQEELGIDKFLKRTR